MKVLIINSAQPPERNFADPIKTALDGMDLVITMGEWQNLPDLDELNEFDAIIISASPRGDNGNFQERIERFQWLKTVKTPVLGVCAGHQLIGTTFGGTLLQNQESEIGFLPVQVQVEDPLFAGHEASFNVEQCHNDSTTLPEDFVLLVSSPKCKVQAMRHKEKPIFSLQWHAEISNPEIFRNFIERVKVTT